MNRKVIQRLLWKDVRTLRTLAIAGIVMILGFFLLLVIFASMSNLGTERISVAVAIWFMIPLLIAYGAPAVLVGGEEESGSLAWLRTLPASWQAIVTSNLLVTIGCWLLASCVATACLLAYWSSLSEFWMDRMRAEQSLPEPFWIVSAGSIAIWLLVMLSSFLTAYWFRSPITALLVTIPVAGGALFAFGFAAERMVPRQTLYAQPSFIAESYFGVFAMLAAIGLAVLLAATFFAAWRRLTWPESRLSQRVSSGVPSDAYRPPMGAAAMRSVPSITRGRPRIWGALLWLQMTPIRWYLVILMIIGILGGLLILAGTWGQVTLGSLICGFSLLMISAFTFYGDSVRKRCVFLHDRGVSPTVVWLTRVIPTLVASLLVLAGAVVATVLRGWWQSGGTAAPQWDNRSMLIVSIGFAAFALSQLVSQWSPRPTLAFFAGPVFVHLAAMFLASLLIVYTGASAVLFVTSAILLFASWKLTPKWMSGNNAGRGYVLPLVGYIVLALMMPYILVLTTRWVTTPPELTAWRNEMFSRPLPSVDDDTKSVAILNPAYVRRIETLATAPAVQSEGRAERLAKELAETNSIGEHLSFKELWLTVTRIPSYGLEYHQDLSSNNLAIPIAPKSSPGAEPYPYKIPFGGLQSDAIRVLLKWARVTRQAAIDGQANFDTLLGVAEPADLLAARVLRTYADQQGMTPDLRELIALLPDAEFVRQSRINSLTRSWRRSQSTTYRGQFAGESVRPPDGWWLAIERERSERFLDELCKYMIDQWETSAGFGSPDAIKQLRRLEHEAYLVDHTAPSSYHRNPPLSERLQMTADVDTLMADLRRRLKDTEAVESDPSVNPPERLDPPEQLDTGDQVESDGS